MKRVKQISLAFYQLSRIAAVFFILLAVYGSSTLWLHKAGFVSAPVELSGEYFTIFFPFTRDPFLLGDYTVGYLFTSLSLLLLYGIFLWLLSKVFFVFMQPKIFVPANMQRFRNFYRFNLFVPLLFIFCLLLLGQQIRDAIIIAFLHLMLGIFIFFITTIFQQGLVLQEEQDQTL